MALALRLYSLEIRVKWQICRHLGLDRLPRVCKTHDLSELIIFSGLWADLEDPANVNLISNWDTLAGFSKLQLNDSRDISPRHLSILSNWRSSSNRSDDPTDGVLAWLSRYP